MVNSPYMAPAAHTVPARQITVQVYDSTQTTALGWWPDVADVRIRQGIGSQDRMELFLPRRLGVADITNELYTSASVALDNYIYVYLSDWRTLSGMQSDAATGRSGSAETALSRLMWTGIIRAIAARPTGIVVSAVAATAGVADASPQAHKIGYGCLLDWNLELSDYRSPTTVDYTGTIEIAHEAYDTSGIHLGDTITVSEDRVLNVDSDTRYNAYGDAARTVYSMEWTERGLTVTFSARAPNVVNDQLMKLTNVTRDSSAGLLTATDAVRAAGLQSSGDPSGTASVVTITNVENTGTARGAGVGTIKFADGTSRDCVGFLKIKYGVTSGYVPIFAAG